jgi:hypothetical protein
MTDQSELLQALEAVLQEHDVEYELQSADVRNTIRTADGEITPYVMDVDLRIHRSTWVENDD